MLFTSDTARLTSKTTHQRSFIRLGALFRKATTPFISFGGSPRQRVAVTTRTTQKPDTSTKRTHKHKR